MKPDPVCGMGVDEDGPATFSIVFRGEAFFFCSSDCFLLFRGDPEWYIRERAKPKASAVDPVCTMQVALDNAPCTAQHKGVTYYFCSRSCMLEFQGAPDQFVPRPRREW